MDNFEIIIYNILIYLERGKFEHTKPYTINARTKIVIFLKHFVIERLIKKITQIFQSLYS